VYIAEFDVDKIRAWREHEVWGNAFRSSGQVREDRTIIPCPFP
jgi:hypothetical protein